MQLPDGDDGLLDNLDLVQIVNAETNLYTPQSSNIITDLSYQMFNIDSSDIEFNEISSFGVTSADIENTYDSGISSNEDNENCTYMLPTTCNETLQLQVNK